MMSKLVKICHLTSAHPDGDIRIFHKQCVSLAKAGYDVSLIIPNTESRIEKGVNIISFESKYLTRKERMTKTVNTVLEKALELDADVYHFHDSELLRIALKLKRKGKKVIYDVHEDLPKQIMGKYWINPALRKIVSFGIKVYENSIAKRLDGVIAATPFIGARFKKINENTITVNNFPFVDELNNSEGEKDFEKDFICYVGGISKIRGLSELVGALEYCDNTRLILAGPVSPDEYLEELKHLKGWGKVDYLGKVDRPGVASILNKSFAGIVTFYPLPNHVDAQPNKMFEYMSAETPVIGSNFPLWEEIILANNCGLCVDPKNSKDIAKAINLLKKDKTLVKEMGRNGRDSVLNKYNWNIEETKLVSFYNKLFTKTTS
jgi:glycosyltransferase involved in cell wall biosynthesis